MKKWSNFDRSGVHVSMLTMKRLVLSFFAATLGCAAATAPAFADGPGPLRPAGVGGPLGDEQLSDETTVTRFGYPTRKYKIRSGPGKRYRTVGRLHYLTEDRAQETYLILRSKLGPKGGAWLNIRVPRRPNGSKGWVPARALRRRTVTTAFEIDKGALKGRLFKDGHEIWTSSIGIGARRHADAQRPLLGARAPEQPRRQPRLRAVRLRHLRLLATVGLARRRRRRHPRHQPARADPRPSLTRVRARPEREDHAAQGAHAGRHADLDPRLS